MKTDDIQSQEEPQIFAVSKDTNGKLQFTRRQFLEKSAVAATAVTLSGCMSPTIQPESTAVPQETSTPTKTTKPTRTPTPTRTKIPTETPTLIPTKTRTRTPTETLVPMAMVKGSTLNVRYGPSTDYPVVGGLASNDTVLVLGRNEDGGWLRVRLESKKVDGWVRADLLEYDFLVEDLLEVTPQPTPTKLPGEPGKTRPGNRGVDYEITNAYGLKETYTLPCGSDIPPGAVCVCNCVTACSCDAYVPPTACGCDGVGGDTFCTCDMVHYWYPN